VNEKLFEQLQSDHSEVKNSLHDLKISITELSGEIKSLSEKVEQLAIADEKLHSRVSEKGDDIRLIEKDFSVFKQSMEHRLTELEAVSKSNRWWIAGGLTAVTAICTALAVFF